MTLALHACRVELDEVNCDFANRFSGVALNSRPVSATHSRKHRCFTADIFGEHVQLIGWDKQSVGWIGPLGRGVFNKQVLTKMLPGTDATLALYQFLESADAVDFMNHIVTLFET